MPKFSVGCDIVVKDKKAMLAAEKFLETKSFSKKTKGTITGHKGDFLSLAAKKPVLVTFDVLSGTIEGRITGTYSLQN